MSIGGLFSGIGGLELGLQRALGWPVAFHAEKKPFCRGILVGAGPTHGAMTMSTTSQETTSSSCAAASPVSPFRRPAGGAEWRRTCGRRFADAWRESLPDGWSPRTSQLSLLPPQPATLPSWATRRARLRCRPAWLVRLTTARGGSWLPTPTSTANHDAPSMRKWPAYRIYQEWCGRTSPRLWEWMMGFPAGWTASRRSGTP